MSIVFLFVFADAGVVNGAVAWLGTRGPNWFSDFVFQKHILRTTEGACALTRGARVAVLCTGSGSALLASAVAVLPAHVWS